MKPANMQVGSALGIKSYDRTEKQRLKQHLYAQLCVNVREDFSPEGGERRK